MRRYNYRLLRVDYPLERGYRMEPVPLPDWIYLTVECDSKTGSKRLFAHSRIHVDKRVQVGPSYSDQFTDTEIIKEQSAQVGYMFLS